MWGFVPDASTEFDNEGVGVLVTGSGLVVASLLVELDHLALEDLSPRVGWLSITVFSVHFLFVQREHGWPSVSIVQ